MPIASASMRIVGVDGFENFAEAMRRKPVREIEYRSNLRRLAPQ